MNYHHFNLHAADPGLCEGACAKDPKCRAFTYVHPGVQGPKARCWLKHGVPPEEVDPNHVPRKHREIFLKCAQEVIVADGEVDPNEAENYELLKALLK